MSKMDDCIFCKIVKGEIPSSKIHEDEFTIAFLDISPINKGHTLVIPKKHFVDIHDLPEGEFRHVAATVKMVADAVKKATGCPGINILQANGKTAGQEVFHFHVHVIPRFEGDGSGMRWLKKEFAEGEMRALLEKIKAKL